MFAGFSSIDIPVSPSVTIHGVTGGSGPALLLLHGFPQSHLIWHRVADALAAQYTVVALDLRGYGASSKPAGSAGHDNYSKRVMADDCAAVMTALGHEQFFVCAHDRGARVAHKLCVNHPQRVRKAILLDICPTLAMYSQTDFVFAKAYFHWFFLIQPTPLPETAISSNPVAFAENFMGGRHAGLGAFHPDAFAAYVEVLKQPEAVHAMCEDYRAAASVDMEEAKEDIQAGRQIQCPIRVLWGKHGVIEKCFDAVKEWTAVSASSVEGNSVPSGHYIPEEVPDVLLKNIREFLVE